jgi:hypothetical protein
MRREDHAFDGTHCIPFLGRTSDVVENWRPVEADEGMVLSIEINLQVVSGNFSPIQNCVQVL